MKTYRVTAANPMNDVLFAGPVTVQASQMRTAAARAVEMLGLTNAHSILLRLEVETPKRQRRKPKRKVKKVVEKKINRFEQLAKVL
jgi:hypothetical protein